MRKQAAHKTGRCRVCGITFGYRSDKKMTLCQKHRNWNAPPRGNYMLISYIDGLDYQAEEDFISLRGRRMDRTMLVDLCQAGGMDGAIVRHIASGRVYKIWCSAFEQMAD